MSTLEDKSSFLITSGVFSTILVLIKDAKALLKIFFSRPWHQVLKEAIHNLCSNTNPILCKSKLHCINKPFKKSNQNCLLCLIMTKFDC